MNFISQFGIEYTINNILYVLILLIIANIVLFIIFNKEVKNKNIKSEVKDEDEESKVNKVSAKESSQILDNFDRLLKIKFDYYFQSELLAYFMKQKEIEKKIIIQLKNTYYADVEKSLSDQLKTDVLNLFSKQGAVLYVHQTFLRLLNEYNIKYQGNGQETLNRRVLEAYYDTNNSNKG